ncbi:MAG: ABC transporter ATP-binding protein, partial [Desulfobacteraceae bacterium]|nr:ABC transporter ATP-binding protein [Desulfobacteraceae bacterium]
MKILEIQNLNKSFGGLQAINNLSISFEEGEMSSIIGPNGAGKTTTILMLLGLTEPASGSAQVYGYNPTREPLKVKRLAGYLPENVGFYDNLTARENLMFIAELNGIGYTEANRKIDELLEMVGIGDVADLAVGKFSRGMKQR